MAGHGELAGVMVGVTADRRADEQTAMLERLGAEVVRGPAIRTLPVGDVDALRSVTEGVIQRPPAYLVANTGLGMRSWWGLAATWGLDQELKAALGSARVAARGPKAAAAVTVAGLDVWWRADTEQLASVAARLVAEGVGGMRVAVQLHGDDRQDIAGTLRAAGADVVEVPVYRWTLPDDVGPALRLVDMSCRRTLTAVTFTTAPAVRNLLTIARRAGRHAELVEALNGPVLCVCVGPVCAAAATEEGILDPVVPDHWRLGPMVRALCEELRRRRRSYQVGPHQLTVFQGLAVSVDEDVVRLTERERAVLGVLVERPGAPVARRTLLRRVWRDGDADPHVVDTTVARLRAKLGPTGRAVQTVPRRGYRFAAGD